MATDALIVTSSLSKRYHGAPTFAFKDLSLRVASGEVYGFLGPNGAGKTTTIRTLLGFLQPTAGQATICDLDIVKDSVQVKSHVGYLSGDVALYQKMTGGDLLKHLQSLQPLKHADYFTELVRDFEVDLNKPIGELSRGNKQKIGLLQALMHEPEVLILDEPTTGLDPLMQEVFYKHITISKQRGVAVFLSSHNLSEVQHMCDRAGIIRSGKLVKELAVSELDNVGAQRFTITFAGEAPRELANLPGVILINLEGHQATVQASKDLRPLLAYLSTKPVTRLANDMASLEDEFLQFYEDDPAKDIV